MSDPGDMVRISQHGTRLPASSERYRTAFRAQRGFVLRGAIEPVLLDKLRALLGRTSFVANPIAGLGRREIERPPLVGKALDLLLSRGELLRWLEQVTGCEPITQVGGAVARTQASPRDKLDWHDDMNHPEAATRRLAVTVALTDMEYSGGLFELRRVGTTEPILTFKHEQAGTILIFDVSPQLEHRVAPLTDGGPRVVYAGWFTG